MQRADVITAPQSQEELRIRVVSIPEFEKELDEAGKTYYSYTIQVTAVDPDRTWTVKRRFCQFYDLYNSISAARKVNFPVPSLLQFSFSQYDLASSRIKKLERFLMDVLVMNDLTRPESLLLHDFLHAGGHYLRSSILTHSGSGTISPPMGLEEEDEECLSPPVPVVPDTGWSEAAVSQPKVIRKASVLNYVDTDDFESDVQEVSVVAEPCDRDSQLCDNPPGNRETEMSRSSTPSGYAALWMIAVLAASGAVALYFTRSKRR